MLSTLISAGRKSPTKVLSHFRIQRLQTLLQFLRRAICAGLVCIGTGFFLSASHPATAGDAPSAADSAARTRKEFDEANGRFRQETNNAEAAWQFGRACFNLSASGTNKTERADVAKQGIAACRQSIARNPASAPAHYYLGMNLGQLADAKRNLAALRLVKEMEREFKAATELDEHFDYAGPNRNLGLLYLQAPVIASIGSRSKARQNLRRAVELAPDYPENRLNLMEASIKWGDLDEARREAKALEELWPEARRNFSGLTWEASWQDWDKRWKAARRKLEQTSKPLTSPHQEE